MKKNRNFSTILFFLTITLFWGQVCNAQSENNKCGADKNDTLNQCEAKSLDSLFSDSQKNKFDFTNKRALFFDGTEFVTKDNFFNQLRTPYREPKGFSVLTEDQKSKTGYDILITINIKAYNTDHLLKQLPKKQID